MCLPLVVAAGMAVMSMATTAMQIQQQNDAAGAQMDAATAAARQDYILLNRKQEEVGKQEALEATERVRQGERERAKMRVAMGEAGVAGVTPLRVLGNSMLQEQYDVGVMEANRDAQFMSVQDEKNKVNADAASRINVAKSNVVSPFMAGLQIAGSGVKGYMSGYGAMK